MGSLQELFPHRLESEGSIQKGAFGGFSSELATLAVTACLGLSVGTPARQRMEALEIQCHISGMYFPNNKQTRRKKVIKKKKASFAGNCFQQPSEKLRSRGVAFPRRKECLFLHWGLEATKSWWHPSPGATGCSEGVIAPQPPGVAFPAPGHKRSDGAGSEAAQAGAEVTDLRSPTRANRIIVGRKKGLQLQRDEDVNLP